MEPAKPEDESPESDEDLNAEEVKGKKNDSKPAEAESSEKDQERPDDETSEKPESVSESSPPPAARSALSGVSKLKVAAIAGASVIAGTVGIAYVPGLFEKDSSGSRWEDVSPKVGFTLGELSAGDPVESIVVTLKTGAEGDDLDERVDLHLGTGFPFCLFPLGGNSMSPAFAAFSQKTSLTPGSNSLPAGGSATFEFHREGENGRDLLESTTKLMKDLVVGDLSSIGFSSLGKSNWVLEGYIIEVNGKLFAKHDSLSAEAGTILSAARKDLDDSKPEIEILLSEIKTLSGYIATGLASDKDKADLKAKEDLVKESSEGLNLLAGQAAGFYPWYLEKDKKFTGATAASTANSLKEVSIRLIAGGGEQPGTRNHRRQVKGSAERSLSAIVILSDIDNRERFS